MNHARRALAAIAAALTLSALVLPPRPALAQDAQVEKMVQAFQRWAANAGLERASLAIVRDGEVVGTSAVGSGDPERPEPVASLSKAITARCVLMLAEDGRLSLDDTIGARLATFADKEGLSAEARAVTLADLITHTSGLKMDPTQGGSLEAYRPFDRMHSAEIFAASLKAATGGGTYGDRAYYYNNANYAGLATVIEAVTGERYDTHCAKTVLQPLGVANAGLNPEWAVMGAFGGWKLSAEDYAKFMTYFTRQYSDGQPANFQPGNWPMTEPWPDVFYSLGTLMRRSGDYYNFWHSGAWDYRGQPPASFGAFYAIWNGKIGFAANYQPVITDAEIGELDRAMWQAASN